MFKGLNKTRGLNNDVRAIREKLIEQRHILRELEEERNRLIITKYATGWDVEVLMYQFGMTEANVIKVITASKEK